MIGVPTFEAKSGNFLMNYLFHCLNYLFRCIDHLYLNSLLFFELPGLTGSTDCVLGDTLLSFDHNGAVWTGAKPQVGMTPKM